jgi:hypothetical protein
VRGARGAGEGRWGDEGRRSAGGVAGFDERRAASSPTVAPTVEGLRGRNVPIGVSGLCIGGVRMRSGGSCSPEEGGGGGFDSPGLMVRARLYSRQQVGHRHSTTSAPSGLL